MTDCHGSSTPINFLDEFNMKYLILRDAVLSLWQLQDKFINKYQNCL